MKTFLSLRAVRDDGPEKNERRNLSRKSLFCADAVDHRSAEHCRIRGEYERTVLYGNGDFPFRHSVQPDRLYPESFRGIKTERNPCAGTADQRFPGSPVLHDLPVFGAVTEIFIGDVGLMKHQNVTALLQRFSIHCGGGDNLEDRRGGDDPQAGCGASSALAGESGADRGFPGKALSAVARLNRPQIQGMGSGVRLALNMPWIGQGSSKSSFREPLST